MGYLDPSAGAMLPQFISGVTDIDDSVQTETTPYSILTIAAPSGSALRDVNVWLDLAKATTGFAAVESTATVQFAVARKIDGTNIRREAYNEAALSGTNAANRSQRIPVGDIAPGETVYIYAVFSADVTADMEIPYKVSYRGPEAPTVTPVAAG
jgi:hypothetical protein